MAMRGLHCGREPHADWTPGNCIVGVHAGVSCSGVNGLYPPEGPPGGAAVTELRSLSSIVVKGSACAVPAPANSRAGATAAAAATPNAAMSRFVMVLWVVFMIVFPFLWSRLRRDEKLSEARGVVTHCL
jgi:hypothetical protein